MNINKELQIKEIAEKLISKTYSDKDMWYGGIIENDDKSYILNIKFSEDFISEFYTSKFSIFQRDLEMELHKIEGYKSTACRVGCSGCSSIQKCPYKIQFSEGIHE